MEKEKRILTEIARIILGLTFMFSGFVKSVDPYGTAYKVVDYLAAFHLSFFSFLEMPISFFLCGFEMALGIVVLLGLFPKWSSKLMLLTMCFMTPLTLYLAIANPVSDCGCFGDAIAISNWDTFYKNIVLLALAIWLAVNYQLMKPFFTSRMQKWALSFIVLFSVLFLLYNYIYEPLIDFRPYKIGANLPEQMTVDESKLPVMEHIFIYEKDSVQKEFTEDNYPWQDSTWVFVDRITKIVKEGEYPKITDFVVDQLIIDDETNEVIDQYDVVDEILEDESYTFLIIAPQLPKVEEKEKQKFTAIANYAEKNGYNVYLSTSSTNEDILKSIKKYPKNIRFGATDEKVLKTIIRSNPSLILIKDGDIIGKWSKMSIPDANELNKPIEKFISDNTASTSDGVKVLIIILLLLIPLGIIKIIVE